MKQFSGLIVKLILFYFLLIGCKKNRDVIDPIGSRDYILYTDIVPDTTFTSVNYWQPGLNIPIPVPSDTSAGMDIDPDKDGVKDIHIEIATYYHFISASNPDYNYNFMVKIRLLRSSDSVACKSPFVGCQEAIQFIKDSLITDKLHSQSLSFYYMNFGYIYLQGSFGPCNISAQIGDVYCGFKIGKDSSYRFGWVLINFDSNTKTLTLKEFAINQTLNRPIKAGQRE